MARFLEWSLFFVIAGSVLVFGAVQPHVYPLMEICIILLVFLIVIPQTWQGTLDLPVPISILPFILLIVFQIIPLPPRMVFWLSPSRRLAGDATSVLGDPSNWITLSVYPHQTLLAFCKVIAYCGAFALAAFVFDPRKRSSTLIRGLVGLGCFEAAYGLVQYLTGFQKIFTFTKQYYTEEATGTYINRNHFAGLIEMIMPLVVAHIFYLVQSGGRVHGEGTPFKKQVLRRPAYRGVVPLYVFVAALLVVALLFSRSRLGILSALFSLVLMGFIGQIKAKRRAWMLVTLLMLGSSVIYAVWIGLGPVLSRYEHFAESAYLQTEGRLSLWKDATRLIGDYPIFGTGLGTFATAFPRYQDVLLEYSVPHLHNDYLQVASEAGVVGLLLLFSPIFLLFAKMIVAFVADSSPYSASILLGCIGSVSAILIHTLGDFNLQIPANALVFSVILGLGYKAASARRVHSGHSSTDY